MDIDQILDHVRSLQGVLVLTPTAGSEFPEIAWGDAFVYFAPDGQVPQNQQPFATIVTKDYPDDATSQLGDGRWRLNVQVGRGALPAVVTTEDPSEADAFVRHPVYGDLGWAAVVAPGARTSERAVELIDLAYADARARWERRAGA